MSPSSGTGRPPIAAGRTTSNSAVAATVSWRTCSAACARRLASVRVGCPRQRPGARGELRRSCVIPGRDQPLTLRRPRCPATSSRSRCCSTSALHVSHRPHAGTGGRPTRRLPARRGARREIRSSELGAREYTAAMSARRCDDVLPSPSSRCTSSVTRRFRCGPARPRTRRAGAGPTPSRAGTAWCRRPRTCRPRGRGSRRTRGIGRRRTSPDRRRRRRRGAPRRWPGWRRSAHLRCVRGGHHDDAVAVFVEELLKPSRSCASPRLDVRSQHRIVVDGPAAESAPASPSGRPVGAAVRTRTWPPPRGRWRCRRCVVEEEHSYVPSSPVSSPGRLCHRGATGPEWQPCLSSTATPDRSTTGTGARWVDRSPSWCFSTAWGSTRVITTGSRAD